MSEPQVLIQAEVVHIIERTIEAGTEAVMSYLAKGKWHICDVAFKTLTASAVHLEIKRQKKPFLVDMEVNQPVGISVQHEFNKYIFETVVVGFESSVNESCGGKVVLELPDKVECMQRRAFSRVNVPAKLNVKVIFWHRGYLDDRNEAPAENYWEGRLVDLAAAGLQITVDLEQGANFRAGQLVGLQFTPMSYQKPILLEAQVIHLAENAERRQLCIGVEFLGLEINEEGRQKLRRIIDVVGEYEKQNPPADQAEKS